MTHAKREGESLINKDQQSDVGRPYKRSTTAAKSKLVATLYAIVLARSVARDGVAID